MKNKISHYRPAAAAFLSMMAMGLTSSTLSFFLEPICEALQVGRGSFTLMFSLMTVSGALSTPVIIFLLLLMYLIFGRAGSSLLRGLLSSCGKQGATLECCALASHCSGCCC